ncbi:hypothetical protein Tco_1398311 [Tanacetum coccineum]
MLVIMPFDYLKLCDSNDSAFGVDNSSKFPVSSKSIELLSFSPPIFVIIKSQIPTDALQITPVDNNNAFSSPPTPDVLIKFVNDLDYPRAVRTLSDVVTNDMFQPWRGLTTIINLCFTGKTSGFKRPRAPHKFHPRPGSPLHFPNEESVLGYLKFSVKGTKRGVFGMPIPNNLITTDIQGEQYYNAYLEKVAKHQRYLAGEEVSDPDSPVPKPAKATKPKATKQSKPLAPKAAPVTKPAAVEAPKPTSSQPPKPTPATTEPSKKDQSE